MEERNSGGGWGKKGEIKEAIHKKGVETWKKGMELKKTLGVYKGREWGAAKYIRVVGRKEELARARGGDWMTGDRTGKWKVGVEKCPGCGKAGETREHIIWECEGYKDIRDKMGQMMENEGAEWATKEGGDMVEKTRYVLGVGDGEKTSGEVEEFWEQRMGIMGELWKKRGRYEAVQGSG